MTRHATPAQAYREWVQREVQLLELAARDGEAAGEVVSVVAPRSCEPTLRRQHCTHWERVERAELASGRWLLTLADGDKLEPHAIGVLLAAAQAAGDECRLVSFDEDTLGANGATRAPRFKPGWSPDAYAAGNYLGRAFMRDRSITDLAQLGRAQARHVPAVLLHQQHPYEYAGDRRVDHPLRGDDLPRVSLIVPFRDKPALLRMCTSGILEQTDYPNFELILVNNQSCEDETAALLAQLTQDERVRLLDDANEPFNYSAVNNRAAEHATGDVLVFVNNDIEVLDSQWLQHMVGWAMQPQVGLVGALLLYPNGSVQHAGVTVGIGGFASHPFSGLDLGTTTAFGEAARTRNVSSVTGACMAVRREVFSTVGGFDERFILCGSDVELGLRLTQTLNLRHVMTPHARLVHHESASRKDQPIPESDCVYSREAYADLLEHGDPYYNPNLTLADDSCTLSETPADPLTGRRGAGALPLDGVPAPKGKQRSPRTKLRRLPQRVGELWSDGGAKELLRATARRAAGRAGQPRGVGNGIAAGGQPAWGFPTAVNVGELSERDSVPFIGLLDCTRAQIEASRSAHRAWLERGRPISSATWVLPRFEHAYYGGVFTIFRFIEGFAERGIKNQIVVYDTHERSLPRLRAAIADAYPSLADVPVIAGLPSTHRDPLYGAEPSDIGIATFWMSAYALVKSQRVGGRFYFVQDFEPLFYPASASYALAEQTYRFGFEGIVNTPGLADAYRAYGNETHSFVPAVDSAHYYPPAQPRPTQPVQIVFYGRPSTDRNAFGLGLAALERVKARYGDRVDIVAAGEAWNPKHYGAARFIRSAGLLNGPGPVGELYRASHIGLVFMLTKHPSYQPLEFMASGCATVTNINESNKWLFNDGHNALVSEPTASAVAEQIGRLIDDPELRERIAAGGAATVANNRWPEQIERVWSAIAPAQTRRDLQTSAPATR